MSYQKQNFSNGSVLDATQLNAMDEQIALNEIATQNIPAKTSDLTNDSGFITEADIPVISINGKTGTVVLNADSVEARSNTWMPSASDVGADASGTATSVMSAHNLSPDAHGDVRDLITNLTNRFNALADSDDTTLDQLSEIVAIIKSNKSLIEAITTNKVNVDDIVDNLTTNISTKPLSAAQGVALKSLIDAITIPVTSVNNKTGIVNLTASDVGALPDTTEIPTVPSALKNPNALTINTYKHEKDATDGSAKLVVGNVPYEGSEAVNITDAVNNVFDYRMNSVRSWGAKGDGTTDDTWAFQKALESKQSVVFVPGGTYNISNTIVITENSCLELSQDTLLNFTNTSGNCIEMRGSATLRGNHGNINVSSAFAGNVISVDTGLDGVAHASIPPYLKSTPMWKRQRFIHDINITRTEGGFQGSLTGGHSGTALYISANYETTESYDGSSTAPITYIWGMSVSGLRIAGAFDYGINIQNKDKTTSGYDDSNDPAWNHDMRIEAVIVGCETGVRVFNCNTAHLDVTIQPTISINKVSGSQVKYAKNGIILEHSKNIDLSQSIVWDWNSNNTLVDSNEKYKHIALIGMCRGAVISDFLYNESGEDIRDLIYTDTLSNFDSLIILQEPITRWFRIKDNEPYFFDGNADKRLALKSEVDEYFDTNRVASFTNSLAIATDKDGSIFNGIGYKNETGAYDSEFTSQKASSSLYFVTGFIPVKAGDVLRGAEMSFVKANDGDCRISLFDASMEYITTIGAGNLVTGGNYYVAHTGTDDTFIITIKSTDGTWPINENVAFVRLQFLARAVGENPIISVNDEIKFVQNGFLADGVKVKGDSVVLYSPGGKAFNLSVSDNGTITTEAVEIV